MAAVDRSKVILLFKTLVKPIAFKQVTRTHVLDIRVRAKPRKGHMQHLLSVFAAAGNQ